MILTAQQCSRQLRWTGRTLYDASEDALFFNWSCSGFTLRFYGTRVSLDALTFADRYPGEADSLPWYAVFLDGKAAPERKFSLPEGNSTTVLFEYALAEEHILRVVKLSEGSKGRAGIRTLTLEGELLSLPPETEKRRIEFIGDSITCGFGGDMMPEDTVFSTEQENGLASYAAIAADLLGADYHCVCISGIPLCWAKDENYRMVLPWVPDFQTSARSMEGYYEYADRYCEEAAGKTKDFARWDFSRFVPDAVVINLGTNDAFRIRVSGNDPAEVQHFQARYTAFLKRVRALNGNNAWIVCTLGSMDYFLYDNIEKAAEAYRAETGDGRVACMKFGAIDPWGEGIGGLGHPSGKTHARMGRELAERLRTLIEER
ncbi:MAG TPA: GDSL-type esterase/lipase family protein [Feifaniaceae bacterium]|nr:GDSL-type esterase/lipase family protein [Feifaniaceae bacterium]